MPWPNAITSSKHDSKKKKTAFAEKHDCEGKGGEGRGGAGGGTDGVGGWEEAIDYTVLTLQPSQLLGKIKTKVYKEGL